MTVAASCSSRSTSSIFTREPSAMRHGVPRVDDEIQQDLLDLPLVGHHYRRPRRPDADQLDFGPHEPAQHRLHAADRVAEREQLWARRVSAAECEQLPRETGAALQRTALISLASSCAPFPRCEIHQQQFGRSHDAHRGCC